MQNYYFYPTPVKCEICQKDLTNSMYDSSLNGIWGCSCPDCHHERGGQLGTGRGQRYDRRPDGKFWHTEG